MFLFTETEKRKMCWGSWLQADAAATKKEYS